MTFVTKNPRISEHDVIIKMLHKRYY